MVHMVKPQLAPDGVVVPDAPAKCQRTIGQSFVLKIQTHHFFPQQLRTDLVGIADQISFASTPPKRIETNLCGVGIDWFPCIRPRKAGGCGTAKLQSRSMRDTCGSYPRARARGSEPLRSSRPRKDGKSIRLLIPGERSE